MKRFTAIKKNSQTNQVARHAPKILTALHNHFGIERKDIMSAINGDISANERLGKAARTAEIQLQFAPMVAQKVTQIIQGTEAVNQAQAEIINAAKSAALNIQSMQRTAILGEENYSNTQIENNQKFNYDRSNERVRHERTIGLVEMKAYVDAHTKTVDHELRALQINNQVQSKQTAADKTYETAVASKWLESGSQQEINLIEKPNYISNPVNRIKALGQDVRKALGF